MNNRMAIEVNMCHHDCSMASLASQNILVANRILEMRSVHKNIYFDEANFLALVINKEGK
jgi:hypothetical protein